MTEIKEGISVEKISDSHIRVLFDTGKYHVPAEVSDDPTFCDQFVPDHSANINFDLAWAGIIDISANTLMMDAESINALTERVVNTLK